MDINLGINISCDNGTYSAYISDDIGGSGISCEGDTPEELAEDIASYLTDYAFRSNELSLGNLFDELIDKAEEDSRFNGVEITEDDAQNVLDLINDGEDKESALDKVLEGIAEVLDL